MTALLSSLVIPPISPAFPPPPSHLPSSLPSFASVPVASASARTPPSSMPLLGLAPALPLRQSLLRYLIVVPFLFFSI